MTSCSSSPGVYQESGDGHDRRHRDPRRSTATRTILDGEFKRENGVFVVGADGVAIENLTARNYTENGFFWNGVLGYRGSYLTAYRNGDYGIYAFDSQYGQFDHSYASGSPDSGFYIGQCNPCHAVITDVVSRVQRARLLGHQLERRPVHRELAVAQQPRGHRAQQRSTSEELAPQGTATIAGNLVSHNGNSDAARIEPTEASTPCSAVGIGSSARRRRRHQEPVIDNARGRDRGGARTRACGSNVYPATDNRVTDNVVEGSGLADLVRRPADRRRRQLLRRQHLRDVGAREHRAGDAV